MHRAVPTRRPATSIDPIDCTDGGRDLGLGIWDLEGVVDRVICRVLTSNRRGCVTANPESPIPNHIGVSDDGAPSRPKDATGGTRDTSATRPSSTRRPRTCDTA